LCTTTAEALAMGKFVIIPKHRKLRMVRNCEVSKVRFCLLTSVLSPTASNTFFEQFANCLVYENKKACVASVKWALVNEPKPLSEKEHFMLTWEGANERLYKSSALTKKEVEEWNESGATKADRQFARIHMETMKKGHFIQKFLAGTH
jgi:digalactosyldiacylglycerol synthase